MKGFLSKIGLKWNKIMSHLQHGPPLSAAEKQQPYRARSDGDAQRKAEYLQKEKEMEERCRDRKEGTLKR